MQVFSESRMVDRNNTFIVERDLWYDLRWQRVFTIAPYVHFQQICPYLDEYKKTSTCTPTDAIYKHSLSTQYLWILH